MSVVIGQRGPYVLVAPENTPTARAIVYDSKRSKWCGTKQPMPLNSYLARGYWQPPTAAPELLSEITKQAAPYFAGLAAAGAIVAGAIGEAEHVFKEWEHPRGRDGQWIDKGGIVKVFKNKDDRSRPLIGQVHDLTPEGIHVKLSTTGDIIVAHPEQIEEEHSVARLPGDAHKAEAPVPHGVTPGSPPKPSEESVRVPPAGMRPASDEERRGLKVPPGWRNVHVATDPKAGLRIWAVDSQNRGQYRYSDEHWAKQDEKKFARMKQLDEKLPVLDAALQRDAPMNDTAAVVYLIRKMGIRNGSKADTKAKKKAYGATTLLAQHVLQDGDNVTLDFDGKDGVHLTLPVHDEKLKTLLRDRVRGKGPDDPIFNTNEAKTNAYLKKVTGEDFKIKDLRTHLANTIALQVMSTMPKPTTLAQYKKQRLEVARQVSVILGNTPTVVLKSYVSPAVFAIWTADAAWSV